MSGMEMYSDQAAAFKRISNSLLLVLENLDKSTFEYDTIELIAIYSHDQSISNVKLSPFNDNNLNVTNNDNPTSLPAGDD